MKRNLVLTAALVAVLALPGCKKNDQLLPPVPDRPVGSEFLPKTIQWKLSGAKASLSYNPDRSLQLIEYTGAGNSYSASHTYLNTRIKDIEVGPWIYKNAYSYNADGRIASMIRYDMPYPIVKATAELKFEYGQGGRVSQLKYYQLNGTASELVYTSSYSYDQLGLPAEISTVDKNGTRVVTLIEGYSPKVSFDPLWLVGTEIGDSYALYNYPVFAAMDRLPLVVKTIRYVGTQAQVEKQVANSYTLIGKRLDKQVSSQHYPAHPAYDQTEETSYSY